MKKRSLVMVSVCGLCGLWASTAGAMTTVDFEGFPSTPVTSYTEGRVTFTAVDGSQLVKWIGPNGTYGITSITPPYAERRADIEGGTTFVSVDLGDYDGIDAETIFLEIFGPSGNSLGFTSKAIPATVGGLGMTTLSIGSESCIAYAIFGSRDTTNGSSVRADNFTFSDCPCPTVIPVPGAILLGTIGTGLVGCLRRRRAL
jgi:hypothetical protein